MKAIVLGVGTELTTGQIVNKNGAWISAQLKTYGVQTTAHLVVPDDQNAILDALEYCGRSADLIFITGGLGPTSDDFTRDLIAAWTNTKLIFNESSWSHVQERLTSRGFTVQDIQKQQCFFPEGSEILKNTQGTANGFRLETQKPADKNTISKKMIFALPGPPREIESIWKDSISSWLQQNTLNIDKQITWCWDTLGYGESDIAILVTEALKEKKSSLPIDIGYRVHLPYVEVKLSYPESTAYTSQVFRDKVEHALAPMTVLRNFQDIAVLFSEATSSEEFAFYDFVSNGHLHHRLSAQLKKYKNWVWKQSSMAFDADFFTEEQNFLALLPVSSDDRCVILADWQGQKLQIEIEAPMKSPLMAERRKQYFAEMALLKFYNTLC